MRRPLLRALARLRLLRGFYRVYEVLSALRPGTAVAADDGLPLPPRRLIVSVAGTPDRRWFLESGRLAADSIRELAARHGRPVEQADAMLDFGCGCGRVLRRWRDLRGIDLAGSDANEAAVAWCRANLRFARFATNDLEPPLPFGTDEFDLVYALSVLTHLTEPLQRAWLRELGRIVRADGLLLLSTHGEAYLERLSPEERLRFERGQVVVRWGEAAGSNLCAAFHSRRALEKLTTGFELVEFVPEGAKGNPHQDLAVLRRRTTER
jgi:SAM-dependent methyltransferase